MRGHSPRLIQRVSPLTSAGHADALSIILYTALYLETIYLCCSPCCISEYDIVYQDCLCQDSFACTVSLKLVTRSKKIPVIIAVCLTCNRFILYNKISFSLIQWKSIPVSVLLIQKCLFITRFGVLFEVLFKFYIITPKKYF